MDMECSNRLGEDTDLNSRKSSCFSDLSEIIPNVFSCCGVVSNYTHSWVSVRAGSKVGNDIWESNSSVWKNNNTHTHTHTPFELVCVIRKSVESMLRGKYDSGGLVFMCVRSRRVYTCMQINPPFFFSLFVPKDEICLSQDQGSSHLSELLTEHVKKTHT